PKAQTISGASVYTLGLSRSDDNLAVAMRENSVMTLEPDYTTTYQGFDPKSAESYIIFEMDQNLHLDQSISAAKYIQGELVRNAGRRDRGVRQGPFSVLRNTSMPAVLIELDFICNPEQEKYMASEAGCNKLALAIAEGIRSYKDDIIKARMKANGTATAEKGKNAKKQDKKPKQEENSQSTAMVIAEDEVYKIQFMTSPKKVNANAYKGLKNVEYYSHNGSLKYTTGTYKTRKEAEADLPRVKKKFKDAFIIKMKGSERLE
ncbi:MAG: N-acetylmuramoyl-L-alanine amidase, partial [Paramuribaculum sp.]|nr:N-acetylmuramoyl-L-alanine amidase [Paramuribaculum sp.]